ncbi:MAG: 50S ribosomal protein L4 [Mycoplasmataceae bacterium RC_NB112A]|nr:MAG: 50S ribosomal protein L4 [Mycoplasmataceae bacterium RC_NB112A]KLL01924.1 MAG: 50S ribosomal protein L4 [Mycoplasmataceae bacterium RC_NB112A]
MEQIEVINQSGQIVNSLPIPSPIAEVSFSPYKVSLVYRIYQTNQHQGTKKVKTRGEVVGSTRKIYRQKGTGRARHSSRYAPQFRGGGVAFGPTGQKSSPLKINHKLKKKMLCSVISEKFNQKQFRVIEKINLNSPKTKEANQLLNVLAPQKNRILLVLSTEEKKEPQITRSFRNLSSLRQICNSQNLNFWEVFNSDYLIFTTSALTELAERLI